MTEQKRLTLVEALESVLNETELATLRESEAHLVELRQQQKPYDGLALNMGGTSDEIRSARTPRLTAISKLIGRLERGEYIAFGYRRISPQEISDNVMTIPAPFWQGAHIPAPSNGIAYIHGQAIVGISILGRAERPAEPKRLAPSQVWHWSQVIAWRGFGVTDPIEGTYQDNMPERAWDFDYLGMPSKAKRAARDLVEAVITKALTRLIPDQDSVYNHYKKPETFTYDEVAYCTEYLAKKYGGGIYFPGTGKPAIEYFENIRFRRDDVLSIWQPDSSLEQPESPDPATPAQTAIESPPVDTETTVHVAKDEKPVQPIEYESLSFSKMQNAIYNQARQFVRDAIAKSNDPLSDGDIQRLVAERMGKSPGNVKTQLSTVKRRMFPDTPPLEYPSWWYILSADIDNPDQVVKTVKN